MLLRMNGHLDLVIALIHAGTNVFETDYVSRVNHNINNHSYYHYYYDH
jgi:hypothetical protein